MQLRSVDCVKREILQKVFEIRIWFKSYYKNCINGAIFKEYYS